MTINPNLQMMSYQREGVSVAPLAFPPGTFNQTLVGWQGEGPFFGLVNNFNEAERVAMVMPYDGFLHQWTVKHSNYPNQMQGEWRWVLGRNFGIADAFVDVANPTSPFNPGPHEHFRNVFDLRPGFTDRPMFLNKGDFVWWALGARKGIFTVTRNGFVFCNVSVLVEFLRK